MNTKCLKGKDCLGDRVDERILKKNVIWSGLDSSGQNKVQPYELPGSIKIQGTV
jgi:hypothetical protein